MSEHQRGTPGRAEPGFHPDGGAPQRPDGRAEPHLQAEGLPDTALPAEPPDAGASGAAPVSPLLNDIEAEIERLSAIVEGRGDAAAGLPPVVPPAVPPGLPPVVPDSPGTPLAPLETIAPQVAPFVVPEVPVFAAGPDVPLFAEAPGVAPFGHAMPRDLPPASPPHAGTAQPAPPYDAELSSAPAAVQRRSGRMALALGGLLGLGALVGALLWYQGQRPMERSLAAPPSAAVSAAPVSAAPSAPVQAEPAVAAVQPAAVQPAAAAPQTVPPLVMLPSDQVGAPKPAATPPDAAAAAPRGAKVAAGTPAKASPKVSPKVASKVAGKSAKPGAKPAAKKKTGTDARATRKAAAQKTASKQRRRCKPGELVRVCLGLPE